MTIRAEAQPCPAGRPARSTRRLDGPPRCREPKWNDLDWQREATEHRYLLGGISDDNHTRGGRCDNLLAQECTAAALDESEIRTDLIGAVHRQIELRRLVKRAQRDTSPRRIAAGRLRGRHPNDAEARADALAQKLDKVTRGRARAKTEPHAGLDRLQRQRGGRALLSLNVHSYPYHVEGDRKADSLMPYWVNRAG